MFPHSQELEGNRLSKCQRLSKVITIHHLEIMNACKCGTNTPTLPSQTQLSQKSSHLVLCPAFILHHRLRVNLHVLSLSFLLLDQRGAGHAEDAVDVDAHFDLHFRAVSVWLGHHILHRETSWWQMETK